MNDERYKKSFDVFLRKMSDNSTYNIISNMIGLNLGIGKFIGGTYKDNDYYKFRSYDNIELQNEMIDRVGEAKYFDGSIMYTNKILGKSYKTKISMLENFKVSQTIENDEYTFFCEPNLEGLNDALDKEDTRKPGYNPANIPYNKVRLHKFLFPVYCNSENRFSDYTLIRDFEIEVNFGRDRIKTLEDFKIGYSFESQNHRFVKQKTQSGYETLSAVGRTFDLFKRENMPLGKMERVNTTINGKYSEWSRCRTSRGNRAYKFKVTGGRYSDMYGSVNYAYSQDENFNDMKNYKMHTDMIYGYGSECVHSIYRPDDFVSGFYLPTTVEYPMFISNALLPPFPTVYVDFVEKQNVPNLNDKVYDDLKLAGFIRLYMVSYMDMEVNSGILQKYYGDNKAEMKYVDYDKRRLSRPYDGWHSFSSELSNSEGFTVKFIFPKRRPILQFVRNAYTASSVYMLPPSVFTSTMNKDSDIDIVNNITKNKGVLYNYVDFDSYAALQQGSNYAKKTPDGKALFSLLGGWLFPPARTSMIYMTTQINYRNYLINSFFQNSAFFVNSTRVNDEFFPEYIRRDKEPALAKLSYSRQLP